MSRLPERESAALLEASWPPARIGEALSALAARSALPTPATDSSTWPGDVASDQVNAVVEAAAERAGLQADQVFVGLDELDDLVAHSAPALLRMASIEGAPFLAVLGVRSRRVLALGPDLRIHRLRPPTVSASIRAAFEEPIEADVDRVLHRMSLGKRPGGRARARMIADRLASTRFRGCWLVHLPPGAPLIDAAREAGLPRRVALLMTAHLAQYALFVLSWWLLGRALLTGTVDRGWLLGWVLLLASLIPLRLAATWTQGLAAVSVGAWLRRRLLRGAFRIDRQEIRHKGAGQLFGLVVEAAAIDSMALTGGTAAAFSAVELAVACVVLWAGAVAFQAPLLAVWTLLTGCVAWVYFHRRQAWTTNRFRLTHQLLESMVGHRTRVAQESESARHAEEDESLDRYIERSGVMDSAGLWLTAFVPRGWLVLALASLTTALGRGASPTELAVSVGGILLGYRALQRLAAGASSLAGAAIAGQSVASLVRAASRHEPVALAPIATLARSRHEERRETAVVQARDIVFRYRPKGEAVLRGCTLTIERNTHVLLEGPSGGGKTTLGSILAGLEQPESGLLLVGGMDRAALGAAGWRSRVVMAPQAHDNYLVGASLAFNLLMGRTWPPERAELAEAEAICRELGLGELIDRLPGGLNQVVGETGWQLSQGERIRVFLARALLQRPELLVLDESFSALDSDNVDRAIRCVVGRASTVLAIAHS